MSALSEKLTAQATEIDAVKTRVDTDFNTFKQQIADLTALVNNLQTNAITQADLDTVDANTAKLKTIDPPAPA